MLTPKPKSYCHFKDVEPDDFSLPECPGVFFNVYAHANIFDCEPDFEVDGIEIERLYLVLYLGEERIEVELDLKYSSSHEKLEAAIERHITKLAIEKAYKAPAGSWYLIEDY